MASLFGGSSPSALAARFAPIEKLDAEFAQHARGLANGTGPKLDWTKLAPADMASESKLKDWIAKHPDFLFSQKPLRRRSGYRISSRIIAPGGGTSPSWTDT